MIGGGGGGTGGAGLGGVGKVVIRPPSLHLAPTALGLHLVARAILATVQRVTGISWHLRVPQLAYLFHLWYYRCPTLKEVIR